MTGIVYRELSPTECESTFEVLQSCGLPYSDIHPRKGILFLVAIDEKTIVGTIGLEVYGEDGLLRSLAVLPEYRNKKTGTMLLTQIIQVAKGLNIHKLHLLTTTAEDYFLRKGFDRAERKEAPRCIQTSTEFAKLCPSSSVYMVFSLPY